MEWKKENTLRGVVRVWHGKTKTWYKGSRVDENTIYACVVGGSEGSGRAPLYVGALCASRGK